MTTLVYEQPLKNITLKHLFICCACVYILLREKPKKKRKQSNGKRLSSLCCFFFCTVEHYGNMLPISQLTYLHHSWEDIHAWKKRKSSVLSSLWSFPSSLASFQRETISLSIFSLFFCNKTKILLNCFLYTTTTNLTSKPCSLYIS